MAKKPAKRAESSRKSTTKAGHGGKRAGAGRKPAETTRARADFNAATMDTIGAWLPEILRNLKTLADGGFERVERKFEPDPADPSREICVERKVSVAEPDRAANVYLADRLLGRPRQAVEHSGQDGQPIPIDLVSAIERLYPGDSGS